jgi:hypothetical protein
MLGTDGKEIPVPEEAEVFQFKFVKDGEDYGPVTLSVDGTHKLVVYFSDNVANSPSEQGHTEDTSWYALLNHLKRFSQQHQLSFELKNTDHLKYDMAKRTHMKKVDESRADPTGAWISYKSGTEFKRFKTRDGAKKHVEKNPEWKVASSEKFYDTIKTKKVEESLGDDFADMAKGMKNKDGSPRFANVRQGKPPVKPAGKATAPRPAGKAATSPADWYDQASGGRRYTGDSKIPTGTMVEEGLSDVVKGVKNFVKGKVKPKDDKKAYYDKALDADDKKLMKQHDSGMTPAIAEGNSDDERDERRDARVPADEPAYKWNGKNKPVKAMHNGRPAKKEVAEGYYPTGRKSSYSDNIPEVKIILQHSRALEEGERRYRAIEKIFVENATGERFAIPTNKPGLARVYARHIAEGGTPYDDAGRHITSLCEEYSKMAGFVRATRNGTFNESTQSLVNEATNHYQSLRESLHKLATHRGYNAYFESWAPTLTEDSEDTTDLSEMFSSATLDPRIESVMPILRKLNKNLSEMTETDDLGKWADDIIGESLGVEKLDELSPKTLGSYITKGTREVRKDSEQTGGWGHPGRKGMADKAIEKRVSGIGKATGKLVNKAEEQLPEAAETDAKKPFNYADWKGQKSINAPKRGKKDAEALGKNLKVPKKIAEGQFTEEFFSDWAQWKSEVERNALTSEHVGGGVYEVTDMDGEVVGRWDENENSGWFDRAGQSDWSQDPYDQDDPAPMESINEDSPLGAMGFSKEFISAVYRGFRISNTELPEKKTKKPLVSELGDFVFLSKTNSGKAFAASLGNAGGWHKPRAHILIDKGDGRVENEYMVASKAMAQIEKGEYYAIPLSGGSYSRTRGQGTTRQKRDPENFRPQGVETDSAETKTYNYLDHVEQLYGPKIKGEMRRVAEFAFTNLRRFGTEKKNYNGATDQERALEIANMLEKLAEKSTVRGSTGSWSDPSYMERYLKELGKMNSGWGSIPNNYYAFVKAMDETPLGLQRFAKFILGTVKYYEKAVKDMLHSEVVDPLMKEGFEGGNDESEAIAQLSTLAQPITINGGGYGYRVDVTKQPLVFTATDGAVLKNCKTLHDLAKWMDDSEDWIRFLDGEEDLDFMMEYNIVKPAKKRNTPWSDQEEHENNMEEGSMMQGIRKGVKSVKRGLQGWGEPQDDPKTLVNRNKGYDDATLSRMDTAIKTPLGFPFRSGSTKHSPADLQKRVVDREMKKRGLAEGDGGQEALNPQGIPESDSEAGKRMAARPLPLTPAQAASKANPTADTPHFPDTKQGAVASFTKSANKQFVRKMDLPNCKVFADPQVKGVWAIDNYTTGVRVIVYLAGYPGPMGDIRGPYDDFEEGQIPKREMMRHKRNDQAQNDAEDDMMEDLDTNQKKAGQLGPVGGPAKVGDLVGANESVDHLAHIIKLARG